MAPGIPLAPLLAAAAEEDWGALLEGVDLAPAQLARWGEVRPISLRLGEDAYRTLSRVALARGISRRLLLEAAAIHLSFQE